MGSILDFWQDFINVHMYLTLAVPIVFMIIGTVYTYADTKYDNFGLSLFVGFISGFLSFICYMTLPVSCIVILFIFVLYIFCQYLKGRYKE